MTTMNRPETAKLMKVLIGYDGSDCAREAIRDLSRAGLPSRGEAIVLSVADLVTEKPFSGYVVGSEHPGAIPSRAIVEEMQRVAAAAMEEARSLAAAGVDQARAALPGWTVRAETVADSPYWALIQGAVEWRADLVVVGSRGHGALGRLVLGSVSQNVLSHAPCSVRIARGRHVGNQTPGTAAADAAAGLPESSLRILLAIDGSADAAVAAQTVGARNWPAGTEIRVVTVVDPRWSATIGGIREMAGGEWGSLDFAREARRRVDAVADELHDESRLCATPVVLTGNPKRMLVEEAGRWGADCIFLGARGHSRFERFLIGSVSTAVATRAHCSVEVVRLGGS
jgi:nucleotide-binding universal stress UspA family protein